MSLWGEWQKCSLPLFFPVVFLSFKAGILRIWSLWSRKLLLERTFFPSPFLSKPKIVPVQNQSKKKQKILTSSLSKESKEKRGQRLLQRWKTCGSEFEISLSYSGCALGAHRWVREVWMSCSLCWVRGTPKALKEPRIWCYDIILKWFHIEIATGITKQQWRNCGVLKSPPRKSWGEFWMDFPVASGRGMGWWMK